MPLEPARRKPSPWPPILFACFILAASGAFYALLRDPTVKLRPRFAPDAMVFAADGSALGLNTGLSLELYSIPDYKRIARIDTSRSFDHRPVVAWSANLTHVALSTGTGTSIEIRHARSNRYFRSLPNDAPGMIVLEKYANVTKSMYGAEYVEQMAWSPDGRYLAILRHSGAIELWDLQTNETISVASDANIHKSCLAWSADSQMLMFNRRFSQLSIYKAPDFAAPRPLESENSCEQLALHANGKLLAQYVDRMGSAPTPAIEAWHVGAMARTGTYEAEGVSHLIWHPTEEVLALLSRGRLELWRPFDGALAVIADPDDTRITAIAFSPDGRDLLVGSDDGILRAWPLAEHAPALFP